MAAKRVNLTLKPKPALLLEVAERVTGRPLTTIAGEFAVARAEQMLQELASDPADDDARVPPLLKAVRDGQAKELELLEAHAAAYAAGDGATARRMHDEAIRVATQLGRDGAALNETRARVNAERENARARALAEGDPVYLRARIEALGAVLSTTAKHIAFLEAHGEDRGIVQELRSPAVELGLIGQEVERLERRAAPKVAAKNGHVAVRWIAFPNVKALGRKGYQRFCDLAKLGDAEFTADASGRQPNLGEVRFYAPEISRGLVALQLAEPAPAAPAAEPTAVARLFAVRLLKGYDRLNRGEVGHWPEPIVAELLAKGIGEIVTEPASASLPTSDGRVPVVVTAHGVGRGLVRGDVAWLPAAHAAEAIAARNARKATAAEVKAGRVALGEPKQEERPRHPLAGIVWEDVKGGEFGVTTTRAFGLWGLGERVFFEDEQLVTALVDEGWAVRLPPKE